MNWKILLGFVLLVLGLIAIGVTTFIVLDPGKPNEPVETPTGPVFPSSTLFPGEADATVTVGGNDGGSVEVRDFVHDGETFADVVNPGSYVLAGSAGYCLADGTCPEGAPTDRYTITYDGASRSFSVALLTEPLKETRALAEDALMARLGLTESEMCTLDAYVGVPYFVNERFTGTNLGFSFCDGSTVLP